MSCMSCLILINQDAVSVNTLAVETGSNSNGSGLTLRYSLEPGVTESSAKGGIRWSLDAAVMIVRTDLNQEVG